MSSKEQILYKLILDYHEALYRQQILSEEKALKELIPCALHFYKSLSETQVTEIMEKMKVINSKVKPRVMAIKEFLQLTGKTVKPEDKWLHTFEGQFLSKAPGSSRASFV